MKVLTQSYRGSKYFQQVMMVLKEVITKNELKIELVDGTKEREAYERGYKEGFERCRQEYLGP